MRRRKRILPKWLRPKLRRRTAPESAGYEVSVARGSRDQTKQSRFGVSEKIKRIFGLITVVVVFWLVGYLGQQVMTVKRVECVIENGVCSAILENYLYSLTGEFVLANTSDYISEIGEKFPRYDQVSIQRKWPNTWVVRGVERQPVAVVRFDGAETEVKQEMTVDSSGVILGESVSENWPVLFINPVGLERTSTRWTDDKIIGALEVMSGFEGITGLEIQTASLDETRLTVITTGGLTAYFNPASELARQLDSLQAILTTARIGREKSGTTIDLTITRPVVF